MAHDSLNVYLPGRLCNIGYSAHMSPDAPSSTSPPFLPPPCHASYNTCLKTPSSCIYVFP